MRPLRIVRRVTPVVADEWPDTVHPVLRRVYAARGIVHPEQVEHHLARLAAPQTLGGLATACDLLETCLREDRHIVVVGDFDADGATGTAVAVRGLSLLGARRVSYRVPHRFLHGYGLSSALVADLLPLQPDLIVTVDNGIAAHAGVAAAQQHGIAVLVTDHHLPGDSLPMADAIVNPNLHGDAFPSKALAGVGVMFYLLLALRARLRERHGFAARSAVEPNLSALLDLVALGTVADLVPLDHNNRVMVEAGLKRIRAGRACAGIAALFEASQRHAASATAADLGYALGPRINAAGRLEDMRLGIECLLTDDVDRARELAQLLSSINAERRELQATMVEQGEAMVQHVLAAQGDEALPMGVVLFDPNWHAGVIGLVASKLRESLHRPVVACAMAEPGSGELRASARSIPGFHIRDALADIDARAPGLLLRFGGHAMAAGMSLRADDLTRFAAAFDGVVRERISSDVLDPVLLTDGVLDARQINLALAKALRFAGPWGQAFPEPMFDGEFTLDSWRLMGESHLRLALHHVDGGIAFDAVMFGGYSGSPPPSRLRAVYTLAADEWNGRERLRLILRHMEPA